MKWMSVLLLGLVLMMMLDAITGAPKKSSESDETEENRAMVRSIFVFKITRIVFCLCTGQDNICKQSNNTF